MNANKYADDFDRDSKNTNENFKSTEQKNSIIIKTNPPKIKKNRTLQFYKFLLYSVKAEIKIHELYDLIRFSNQSEITLWIISLVLYTSTPSDVLIIDGKSYSSVFLWVHLIHVIRGLLGFLIMIKLPRSFKIVQAVDNVPERELENKLFNDIIRDVIKKDVVSPLQRMSFSLAIYFILTIVNLVVDIIDLLVVLSNMGKANSTTNAVLMTYLFLVFLYLAIDLSYIFWTVALKYTFPSSYLKPISDAFSGTISGLVSRFKLNKQEPTDIRAEVQVIKANQDDVQIGIIPNDEEREKELNHNTQNISLDYKSEEKLDHL